jgi:hypothetical protein
MLATGEVLKEARQAGVERMTHCVDDAGVRQHHENETEKLKIKRMLVDDAMGIGRRNRRSNF